MQIDGYERAAYDEMFAKDGSIREHWQTLFGNLEKLQIKGLTQKQEEIDWQLAENGVSYNIYDDSLDFKRKWNLDPIPFIITHDEWQVLTRGLRQRAKLLELIFEDIYTEQKLLKNKILPAEVLYLDSHFIREVYNYAKSYYDLSFYAADISRGPNGKFWIIADKVDAPSGLGYAIENRFTMQSTDQDIVHSINIHGIGEFIEKLITTLKTPIKESTPVVVMLSPGPYNETYFEHSYLSSILDCELVRGEDLLVKDSNLYLKYLSGLKKVDIIIRRVDDRFCDPLELRNDSQLGVAGLLGVLRAGNVKMINPIGVGVLENLGLNPFLNSICKYFLGETLILPQIATWWCGQEKELEYVLQNLNKLIIQPIDTKNRHYRTVCSELTQKELETLKEDILTNPAMYIAQEQIDFSTIPSFADDKILAKKNSIRLFCYKESNEFQVMQGGLVRISSNKNLFTLSNQKGGGSKDLWVLSPNDMKNNDMLALKQPYFEMTFSSIITKRAENIYWLGRYLKRAIITARVLRLNLLYLLAPQISQESIQSYLKTLTHLTMSYPGFLNEQNIDINKELESLLKEENRSGTLAFTLSMLSNVYLNIKNHFSNEARKVFDRIEIKSYEYSKRKYFRIRSSVDYLDELLIYLSAYKELTRESISLEQGLVFYQIGSKVEMAMLLISKMRSLLTVKYDKNKEPEMLQFMLKLHEGYTAYKGYYKSNLRLDFVLEFLLLQPNYSKSLQTIIKDLIYFSNSLRKKDEISMRSYLSAKYINQIESKLQKLQVQELINSCEEDFIHCGLDTFLDEMASLLNEFSNEFTKNYFSHYYE